MIAHGMISQSKGAEGRRNPTVREGAEGRNPTVRGVQKAETRAWARAQKSLHPPCRRLMTSTRAPRRS